MAGRGTVELERKFDAGLELPVPPLATLLGVVRAGEAVVNRLEAVYWDTGDLRLAARGITLRRRSGGKDEGWHLKLPQGPDRRGEMTEAFGTEAEAVPESLLRLVRAHVRDVPLTPVATVSTVRTSTTLYGEDDSEIAEFADDLVESVRLVGERLALSWREWEVELVDGPLELVDAAGALLVSSGAHASPHPSKLAQALGDAYPRMPAPLPRPRRKGASSTVLLSYLRAQAEKLKAMDRAVREDEPDAVHQLRVSARSMRSVLATFRRLVDRATAAHLREELQWMASTVGGARDIEVMRERLLDQLASEPPALLAGPVAERIAQELDARLRVATAAGLSALESPRYFRLLDALDGFCADPPLTSETGRKAGKEVAGLVAADLKRLRKAVRTAQKTEGDEAADAALHEVRKCAKRLRYATEASEPVMGKAARRTAKRSARIQQILGDHQDSVVARQLLFELAVGAPLEDVNGFSLGRLHALEQHRGAEDRDQFFLEWERFKAGALR